MSFSLQLENGFAGRSMETLRRSAAALRQLAWMVVGDAADPRASLAQRLSSSVGDLCVQWVRLKRIELNHLALRPKENTKLESCFHFQRLKSKSLRCRHEQSECSSWVHTSVQQSPTSGTRTLSLEFMPRNRRDHTRRGRGRDQPGADDSAHRPVEVPPQPDRLSVALDEFAVLDVPEYAARTFPSGKSSLTGHNSDSDRSELEEVRLTEDTGSTGEAEELPTEVVTDYWWLQGLLPYLADSQEQPLQKREDIFRGLGHRARWLLKSLKPDDAFGRCTLRRVLAQEMSSSDQITDSLDSWLGLSNEPE